LQVCLSTIALEPNRWGGTRLPKQPQLARLIPIIADAGLRAIEIWEGHLMVESAEDVCELAALARRAGLRVPVVGAYLNMGAAGAELEQQRRKMDHLFRAAELFGSEIVKYFAGNKPYKEADASFKAQAVKYLDEMCGLAERADVLLAAETHGGTVTDCQEGALWWAGQSQSPRHRLLYQAYGHDADEAIEQLKGVAPHVSYVHVAGVRDGQYVPLAEAELDFAALLRAIKAAGFDGWICLEFTKDCTAEERDFDDALVLRNALADREFVRQQWR